MLRPHGPLFVFTSATDAPSSKGKEGGFFMGQVFSMDEAENSVPGTHPFQLPTIN